MRYIILSRLTDEGAETLKRRPERLKEVNQELEKMGVKVIEQYAVFGEYDFVNIVEANDNATLMKAMVELASRGTIRTVTMPAITVDELIEKLKS
ncbi:MAG: GYD domain-containing protein [Archaeoglobaceae archaeon]|nr:GYD domain-containing protein [Archaeoglobaceae archaeon]MDW7990412.1 GYD domain-containing protein [Archaeoglobaceae archaeon]